MAYPGATLTAEGWVVPDITGGVVQLSEDGTSLVSGDGAGMALTLSQQHKRWRELISVASKTPWNDQAGSGLTLSVDTAVTFNGLPTLRLDIPALSSGTYRVGTTTATLIPPYNWDGTQLAVAVRSSNMTAVDGVASVFLGDSTFTNYYSFTGRFETLSHIVDLVVDLQQQRAAAEPTSDDESPGRFLN